MSPGSVRGLLITISTLGWSLTSSRLAAVASSNSPKSTATAVTSHSWRLLVASPMRSIPKTSKTACSNCASASALAQWPLPTYCAFGTASRLHTTASTPFWRNTTTRPTIRTGRAADGRGFASNVSTLVSPPTWTGTPTHRASRFWLSKTTPPGASSR